MATMENLEARRSLGRACRLLFYAPHLPHLPTSMPVSMSAFGDSARRPRPCVERNGARLSSVVSCHVVPYRIVYLTYLGVASIFSSIVLLTGRNAS